MQLPTTSSMHHISCTLYIFHMRLCVVCYVAVCCSVLQCVAVYSSVVQCVAVWCSVLQCVAVCCSTTRTIQTYPIYHSDVSYMFPVYTRQRVAACCSMLQRVAVRHIYKYDPNHWDVSYTSFRCILYVSCIYKPVRCSVLQFVVACCSTTRVIQCILYICPIYVSNMSVADFVAVCCGVLQCVAVCCSVLQCVALYCAFVSIWAWLLLVASRRQISHFWLVARKRCSPISYMCVPYVCPICVSWKGGDQFWWPQEGSWVISGGCLGEGVLVVDCFAPLYSAAPSLSWPLNLLQGVAGFCSVLQCVAVCWNELQCVAERRCSGSWLLRATVLSNSSETLSQCWPPNAMQCAAVRCSVLQIVAEFCAASVREKLLS